MLEQLDDADPDPSNLVAVLEALVLLDQQRAQLLERIRVEASDTRRRQEERSLRQFVLRALDEIRVPQTAGYLDDYVYASERVVLKSRGFAALRRDENRAWRRRPGHRVAYIVPCLDARGQPVPRWMGRSDWDLRERVVVGEAEALWSWSRIPALFRAWRGSEDEITEALYVPLINRYYREATGDEDFTESADPHWLDVVESEAERHLKPLRREVRSASDDLARRLSELTQEEQLWGAGSPAPLTTVAED